MGRHQHEATDHGRSVTHSRHAAAEHEDHATQHHSHDPAAHAAEQRADEAAMELESAAIHGHQRMEDPGPAGHAATHGMHPRAESTRSGHEKHGGMPAIARPCSAARSGSH